MRSPLQLVGIKYPNRFFTFSQSLYFATITHPRYTSWDIAHSLLCAIAHPRYTSWDIAHSLLCVIARSRYNNLMKAQSLNIIGQCRKYGLPVWQCPQFLFLVMGIFIMAATLTA